MRKGRETAVSGKPMTQIGPWPDVATARLFLRGMVAAVAPAAELPSSLRTLDVSELAAWLIQSELAGVAMGRYGPIWPELRRALQADHFTAVAEWELHAQTLRQLAAALQQAGVTAVLLKGAALALTVYAQPSWRTMSDIDLWVQEEEMAAAVTAVVALGFIPYEKADRPLALQKLGRGEVRLYRADWVQGLVEVHWSAYTGWWLRRTANVDQLAIWARKEKLTAAMLEGAFYQMAPEDMVIHLAIHTAVNHQLGMKALQALLDIALVAQARAVQWSVVAQRAKAWRVATALYLVLSLAQQLVGMDGVEEALHVLRPSRLRRWLLHQFASPQSLLAAHDVRESWQRYLLLLLLVDRPLDIARLIWRTVWPEKEWLAARYGRSASRWQHLWRLFRHRAV